MSPELLAGLIGGSVLVTGSLFFLGWWVRGKVATAQLDKLEASLGLTRERLETARAALAQELGETKERAHGAKKDMELERRIARALTDPDPLRRLQRLLLEFPPSEGTSTTSGEPGGATISGTGRELDSA